MPAGHESSAAVTGARGAAVAARVQNEHVVPGQKSEFVLASVPQPGRGKLRVSGSLLSGRRILLAGEEEA